MKIAPRRVALVLVTLAAGALIGACGSASSSSSSSTTSTTATSAAASSSGSNSSSSTTAARRAALVSCLKQHGVTLPTPPAGAGGGAGGSSGGTGTSTNGTGTAPRRRFFGGGGALANNPKLRAAFQACGANFGFRGCGQGFFRSAAGRQRVENYVACVRKNGYDLPNPNFSGTGPVFPTNVQSNPKFKAASAKCQSLLIPPRRSGNGGSSTTAGA
jgi:hypothetical protein